MTTVLGVILIGFLGLCAAACFDRLEEWRIWARLAILEVLRDGPLSSFQIMGRVMDVNEGSIYVVLRELEREGLVIRTTEPGGPERGGRPRAIYRLAKP